MAFRGDDASVLDSIDEDWANFQLPDVPGSEGGDDENSKGIHGKGRGKARRAGGRAGVVKLAKAKAAKPVKCRGCRKKVQGDEIALTFPGCWGCKRALDNLYKLACKQGEEARKFVSEARVCEEACFDLVQNYMAKCPENAVCAGRRRGTWNLLQYIETVKASSGLLKDQVGEFMSKAVYMEFAPTARGGQKSASEAEAQLDAPGAEPRRGGARAVLFESGWVSRTFSLGGSSTCTRKVSRCRERARRKRRTRTWTSTGRSC